MEKAHGKAGWDKIAVALSTQDITFVPNVTSVDLQLFETILEHDIVFIYLLSTVALDEEALACSRAYNTVRNTRTRGGSYVLVDTHTARNTRMHDVLHT